MGEPLGVVGQAGLALLRGVDDRGSLSVQWQDAEGAAQACGFSYALPRADADASVYRQIRSTCLATGTTPKSSGEKGE
jgi:outer membrane usher protein